MKTILFLIFLLFSFTVFNQRNTKDSILSTPWVSVQYGGNWTGGDLAQRYGYLNHLGMFAGWKTSKNWIYGIDGSFIFGNTIRLTGLFDEIVDSYGNITDQNGDIASVFVMARGFHINASVGKIFPVFSPNQNSGIFVHAGAGYLLHKLRIETNYHVVPLLEQDYKKGYDRLTTGVNFHQFVGYALMFNKRPINVYGGFYIQEGLTYNRRNVFFDRPNEPVSKEQRLDLQFGFRVGWLIPIYKRTPKAYYYN